MASTACSLEGCEGAGGLRRRRAAIVLRGVTRWRCSGSGTGLGSAVALALRLLGCWSAAALAAAPLLAALYAGFGPFGGTCVYSLVFVIWNHVTYPFLVQAAHKTFELA